MQEGWTGFVCGVGFTFLFMLGVSIFSIRDQSKDFRNVTEKVVMYEKYNHLDLKSRISAIETCQKHIEGTGCSVTSIGEGVFNGETYIVVVGEKKEVKGVIEYKKGNK